MLALAFTPSTTAVGGSLVLTALLGLVPLLVFFVLLGGLCVLGYKLSPERHAQIRRQLDERDALYDEAPIMESLTLEPAVPAPTGKGG